MTLECAGLIDQPETCYTSEERSGDGGEGVIETLIDDVADQSHRCSGAQADGGEIGHRELADDPAIFLFEQAILYIDRKAF